MKEMTLLRRVFARLEKQPGDRIPNIIMQFSAWQKNKTNGWWISESGIDLVVGGIFLAGNRSLFGLLQGLQT